MSNCIESQKNFVAAAENISLYETRKSLNLSIQILLILETTFETFFI